MKISDMDVHPKVIFNIVYALIASAAFTILFLIYLYVSFYWIE